MKKDNLKQQYRINEQIRVREVRIVGDDVESTVMPTAKALQMAEAQGVDLVEISPNAVPPVCRLIDYSKFLYQQKKRQKEMKAKQVKVDVKEIRFGPQTDDHDYNFNLRLPRAAPYILWEHWLSVGSVPLSAPMPQPQAQPVSWLAPAFSER
jgi:translation initiation factor IF-3